jgi:ornithine cyclodeaminase/alanine dehydrogenase-like protein (mu-crystallin family)
LPLLSSCSAVWDIRPEAAKALADELRRDLKIDVQAADGLAAVHESDIVVTCSSARRAYLTSEMIRPGTFIAAVGADNSDKHEIDPPLYARCVAVVDSLEQAAEIGDLHHALEAGAMTRAQVHASLGEVLTGARPGRTDDRSITLCSTAPAWACRTSPLPSRSTAAPSQAALEHAFPLAEGGLPWHPINDDARFWP